MKTKICSALYPFVTLLMCLSLLSCVTVGGMIWLFLLMQRADQPQYVYVLRELSRDNQAFIMATLISAWFCWSARNTLRHVAGEEVCRSL